MERFIGGQEGLVMKSKKKDGSKNINLALYFGIIVVFIILISFLFKAFDTVRKSKFDGQHRFSIAVQSGKNLDIVSVSPKEGSITKLRVEGALGMSKINDLLIPIDSAIEPGSTFDVNTKSLYLKILLNKRKTDTDLTVIDLVRLIIFSNGVSSEKTVEKSVSVDDDKQLESFSAFLFVDPSILEEKKSIQITNASEVPGLGNKLAKYITNMGGNVVLVNTSSDEQIKSKIISEEDSFTKDKISKDFNIPKEKSDNVSISDIHIIIGKDREDLFQ